MVLPDRANSLCIWGRNLPKVMMCSSPQPLLPSSMPMSTYINTRHSNRTPSKLTLVLSTISRCSRKGSLNSAVIPKSPIGLLVNWHSNLPIFQFLKSREVLCNEFQAWLIDAQHIFKWQEGGDWFWGSAVKGSTSPSVRDFSWNRGYSCMLARSSVRCHLR